MKKLIAVLLSVLIVLSLVGCSSTDNEGDTTEPTVTGTTEDTSDGTAQPASDRDPYIIGVVFRQLDTEALTIKEYLEVMGMEFNCEFIFSEGLTSADEELAFIENAYAAGATGIIDYRFQDRIQMANKCNELGMYYAVNGQPSEEINSLEYFAGAYSQDNVTVGGYFGEFLESFSEDGEKHGILILSGLAGNNNVLHYETTESTLGALEKIYNLTFTQDKETLITATAPIAVENSAGLDIYIYPGSTSNDLNLLTGVSAMLQTGKYDIILSTLPIYDSLSVVVDEVERAFNFDVKIGTMASVSDSLTNAYKTQDIFGNPSVDAAVIKNTSVVTAPLFAGIYNAMSGNGDVLRDENGYVGDSDGKFLMQMWKCTSLEELEVINTYDIGGNWAINTEDLKEMIKEYNPDLTRIEFINLIGQNTLKVVQLRHQ